MALSFDDDDKPIKQNLPKSGPKAPGKLVPANSGRPKQPLIPGKNVAQQPDRKETSQTGTLQHPLNLAVKPNSQSLSSVSNVPKKSLQPLRSLDDIDSDESSDDDNTIDYNKKGGVADTLEPIPEDTQRFIDGLGEFAAYADNKGALYGAGLTKIFGSNVAIAMQKQIMAHYDDPKFKDLMKEFLNQPGVFQFVEGFMLDPYQAMILGARAVLSEMFPVFKVQLDQPNFSCQVNGHLVDHSDHLPIVPTITETVEIERAKVLCMVSSRAKYTKAALVINKIETVPVTNQYMNVNPALGEALNSVVGTHFHSNDRDYLAPVIKLLPKPRFDRMKLMTAHLQKPILNLFTAVGTNASPRPPESEQITLKQFKSFRAFRSSIGDFAKSFDLPYAALCNPVSTIMKWYFPLLEVGKLGDRIFAIGSSEHQRFGNLLHCFQVRLIDGDLFDISSNTFAQDWAPPAFSSANIRQRVQVAEESYVSSTDVVDYDSINDPDVIEDTLGEVTVEVSELPPEHIMKWNFKSSFDFQVAPEFSGIILLSDVYLDVDDTFKDANVGFKARNLEYLAQEKAYKFYAQLLRNKVVNMVVFKSFPLFTTVEKDGVDHPSNFSYEYLTYLFGGYYIRSFMGARLHNGEHILAISRNKVPGWQPIPLAKDVSKANHFCSNFTAVVRYKMFHANLIRNSLLSCGYSSVYKGTDDYPLKKEEGLCLRLVPYTKPTVGTSMAQYNVTLDDIEAEALEALVPLHLDNEQGVENGLDQNESGDQEEELDLKDK